MASCCTVFPYNHFVAVGERRELGSKTKVGASPEDELAGKQLRKDVVLVQLPVSVPRAAAGEQLMGGGGGDQPLALKGLVCRVSMRSTCG